MTEFLYLFLFRAISGAQNGFGYRKASTWRTVVSVMLMIAAVGMAGIIAFQELPILFKVLAMVFFFLAAAGVLGVEDSFNRHMELFPNDVHLWETVAAINITIAWIAAGGNILMIIAATYPALILHKGFVNIGSGLPFFDERTDDATGRTFRIPLLGIAIVRGGKQWRLLLAAFCIILAAATQYFGWTVTVTPLVIDLFGTK